MTSANIITAKIVPESQRMEVADKHFGSPLLEIRLFHPVGKSGFSRGRPPGRYGRWCIDLPNGCS